LAYDITVPTKVRNLLHRLFGPIIAFMGMCVVGWDVLDWGGILGSWQLALKIYISYSLNFFLFQFRMAALPRLHGFRVASPL